MFSKMAQIFKSSCKKLYPINFALFRIVLINASKNFDVTFTP